MKGVVEFLLGAGFGLMFGWMMAHSAIKSECLKLGGFYVGNTTFVCQEKK